MNILIFGSGSSVTLYIRDNKEFFDNNIEILAFVDNNQKKQGNKFIEKEIISPECIFKYNYDAILICSVYEEDIYMQLVEKMKLYEKKIYTRKSFFEKIIFKWYDRNYNLYNKKILIVSEDYGTDEDYKKYYGRYYDLFNIVGIVTFYNIDIIKTYKYDYILLTNFNPLPLENQSNIENSYNLFRNLSNNKYKILTMEVVRVYFNNIKKLEFYQNCNCNKNKFLIIRINRYFMGLGAIARLASRGIVYAKEKGYIPIIDMKTLKTQYLEEHEYGKINAYTKFFEQPYGYDMDDIKNFENIAIMYTANWFSKKEESELVLPKMKPDLYNKFCEFKKKFNNKNVLGVLFRGTDYANLKPYGHSIQPDLNTMIQTVKEKISEWGGGFDLIYLCTEVQEACERFESEFGKERVCYYPQLRYCSDTEKYLAEINLDIGERTKQGKDYWVALNCLAACNSIIAGQTAGTKIALIINNNKYQHSYLFELGKYGVNDV